MQKLFKESEEKIAKPYSGILSLHTEKSPVQNIVSIGAHQIKIGAHQLRRRTTVSQEWNGRNGESGETDIMISIPRGYIVLEKLADSINAKRRMDALDPNNEND